MRSRLIPAAAKGAKAAYSAPGRCCVEKRTEVLSRPVGPFEPVPMTMKRVVLAGWSSMPASTTGSPWISEARRLAMAAPCRSPRACSTAAEVLSVSTGTAWGRFRASHCRHWASAWGWE